MKILGYFNEHFVMVDNPDDAILVKIEDDDGGIIFAIPSNKANSPSPITTTATGLPGDPGEVKNWSQPTLLRLQVNKGGPGSGFHGHEGRPGKVGGSATSTGRVDTYDQIKKSKDGKAYLISPDNELYDAYGNHGKYMLDHPEELSEFGVSESMYPNDAMDLTKVMILMVNAIAAGTIRVREMAGVPAIYTHAMNRKTLRRLQRLVEQNKLHLATKKNAWIGGGSKYATFSKALFMAATNVEKDIETGDWVLKEYTPRLRVNKGGPGSGHHGHAGRPGKRGGSVSETAGASIASIADMADKMDIQSVVSFAQKVSSEFMNYNFYVEVGTTTNDEMVQKGVIDKDNAQYVVGYYDNSENKMCINTESDAAKGGVSFDHNVKFGINLMSTAKMGGRAVVVHEFAHAIDDKTLVTDTDQNFYDAANEYSKNVGYMNVLGHPYARFPDKAISEYSFANVREVFAEGFVAYTFRKQWLKDNHKALHDYYERLPEAAFMAERILEIKEKREGKREKAKMIEVIKTDGEMYWIDENGNRVSGGKSFVQQPKVTKNGLPVHSISIQKGGPGSGFHGHSGRPGKVGGSASGTERFIVPEDAYYLDDRPGRDREATQRWADDISSRGWDVQEVIDHFWKRLGVYPQSHKLNYDPEWGTKPGTYIAYRVGTTSDRPWGLYFGPDTDELEAYAYDDEDKVIHEYEVTIKNPLIVEDKNELVQKLFPRRKDPEYERAVRNYYANEGQRPRPYNTWIRSLIDGNKFGHDASLANRWLDAQLADAIKKKGYDSLVLMAPELPASREIMVLDKESSNLKLLKEYTFKGGQGSGFHGHTGRPGKVGGSSASTSVNITTVDPLSGKESGKTLSDEHKKIINDTVSDIHKTVDMSDPEAIIIGESGARIAGKSDPFGRSTRINGKNYIYLSPDRATEPYDASKRASTYSRQEWFGFQGAENPDLLLRHIVAHEYGHLWWKQNSKKSKDLVKLPSGSKGRIETNTVLNDFRDNVWRTYRQQMSGYAKFSGSFEEGFADMFANFVTGEPMPNEIESWFVENVPPPARKAV